jgi:YesN/AraC family two-component response regulator
MKPMIKYKILIVDDNCEFVKAFKYQILDFLTDKIMLIDVANNGIEALHRIGSTNYDYIFMDINMPELDGIQATRIANRKYRDVNIIAISFHKELDYIKLMVEAGAKTYLVKDEITIESLSQIFSL